MNFINLFSGINLKEILQKLPDAVLLLDDSGRIIWTNREAEYMFGIDNSEESVCFKACSRHSRSSYKRRT